MISTLIKLGVVILIYQIITRYLNKGFIKFPANSIPDADPIFPEGFQFGVSTAAYQVEAGIPLSNWELFEPKVPHDPIKCDELNHFEEDARRAQQLGCKVFRLSFSWSRLNPKPGVFNDEAMQMYRQWLITLKELGMEPMVTLWHFEHPAWVEELGSIYGPQFVDKYADYTEYVMKNICDVCNLYHTVNEPIGFIYNSLFFGVHPPGKFTELHQVIDAVANMMRCHAVGYSIIHTHCQTAKVSFAKNMCPFVPRHSWSLFESLIAWVLNWYNSVAFDVFKTGTVRFLWMKKEIPNIIGAIDFISINHYFCGYLSINPADWGEFNGQYLPFYTLGQKFLATNDFGWGLNPKSLAATCQWVNERWNPNGLKIFVTEHGIADRNDDKRQWFLKESLLHLSILANRGLPVVGYVHWTLNDNYEWAEGRKMKFGLFETNYETQERIPRKSAELYTRIIHNQKH